MVAREEIETPRGRTARWSRSSQFLRIYMTIPRAPLYAEICKYWYAPRSFRTGDHAFDKKWRVFGAPEASLVKLLAVRHEIASCPSLEWIRIDGEELCVVCMRWRNDEVAMLALAEHLADQLERIEAPRDLAVLEAAKEQSAAIYRRKVLVFIAVVVLAIAAVIIANQL